MLRINKTNTMPRRRNNRKRSNKSFKKKVLAVIHKQSEKKVLDNTLADTSITNVANFTFDLAMPAQGDTSTTRDGNQIRLISIRYKGHLELTGSASEGALVRIIMMRLPKATQDGTSAIVSFANLLRPNDFYPRELDFPYKIMYDRTVSIGGGGKSAMIINISKKLNQLIQFNGTGSTDFVNYRYYLVVNTNHPVADELSLDMNSRVVYTDS